MATTAGLIAAAAILVIGGGIVIYTSAPRYSMGNSGGGVSIRLDRRSGDMIGCEGMSCRPIFKSGLSVATPAPPAGFVIDKPAQR